VWGDTLDWGDTLVWGDTISAVKAPRSSKGK
jgi:hypothetical protein